MRKNAASPAHDPGYIISSGEEHRAQIETLGLFVSTPSMCGKKEITPHNVRLCGGFSSSDRKHHLLTIWSSTYFRKKWLFSKICAVFFLKNRVPQRICQEIENHSFLSRIF